MSFWQTSEGDDLSATTPDTTYETPGGGNFDPIPDGTVLPSAIKEVKWDEYEGDRYISARFDVLDGDFKGRVVFLKIKVYEPSAKKRDRALRLLATIDAITGGRLLKVQGEPSDVDLASMCGKPMDARVRIWDMNGKTGNWIEAVGKLGSLSGPTTKPVTNSAPKQQAQQQAPADSFDDDDIPF